MEPVRAGEHYRIEIRPAQNARAKGVWITHLLEAMDRRVVGGPMPSFVEVIDKRTAAVMFSQFWSGPVGVQAIYDDLVRDLGLPVDEFRIRYNLYKHR